MILAPDINLSRLTYLLTLLTYGLVPVFKQPPALWVSLIHEYGFTFSLSVGKLSSGFLFLVACLWQYKFLTMFVNDFRNIATLPENG